LKKTALIFVAFALLLSACGGGDGELAASVNGTEYTVADVNALVFDDSETVSKEQFAQFLGFLVQWDIVVNAAEDDFDIVFTDEEVATRGQEIFETNAEPGVTFEDFLQANAVSEEFVNKVAHLQLVEAAVGEDLLEGIEAPSAEDIEAQRESHALTEVCVSHILVETEDESNAVLDRLTDGEVFGDLAIELSLDTQSGAAGGDLGCTSPTQYVPEFMEATLEAEIDVPFGPVESEFGFHTVLVTERTIPTDEEIIEATRNAELPQVLSNWIGGHLDGAEVTVNEKFGTWQTNPAGVIPPTDPSDTTTTTAPPGGVTTTPSEDTSTTAPTDGATTTTVDESTEETTTTTVDE
jgi:parvulin-like peptidyl-prolyl isomerase